MDLVFRHTNRAIVMSAKIRLEQEGIDCFIKNEHTNTSGAEFGIANMYLELWIHHEADRNRAAEIIKGDVENTSEAPAWTCPACGEENGGNFEFCWNCQASCPA